jgi:hypothetical protein
LVHDGYLRWRTSVASCGVTAVLHEHFASSSQCQSSCMPCIEQSRKSADAECRSAVCKRSQDTVPFPFPFLHFDMSEPRRSDRKRSQTQLQGATEAAVAAAAALVAAAAARWTAPPPGAQRAATRCMAIPIRAVASTPSSRPPRALTTAAGAAPAAPRELHRCTLLSCTAELLSCTPARSTAQQRNVGSQAPARAECRQQQP